MKILKLVFLIIIVAQSSISKAQTYPFVPGNQHLLTEKQLENTQINITPEVMLFSEQGKILSMSSLSLMANPEYKPLFYANTKGKIKTVVFVKKSNQPVLIKQNPEAQFTPGESALDFIAFDLNGNSIKLSDLKGKVVVLNFWFTKCGPCVQEMPQLNELVSTFKDKDVVFLAITFNQKDIVNQFLENTPFNYTILANANDVINAYGVNSYPTSIIINKEGKIMHKELGYRTNIKEVLTVSINALL